MLEKDVERYLKKIVEMAGGECFKFTSPGLTGVPDRLCMLNGTTFFVELKKPGGRLSARQKVMHRRIERQGLTVYTIWSKAEVDQLVRSLI